MDIKIRAKVGDIERTFNASIRSLKDLKRPLNRLSKFIGLRVQKKFSSGGPGWEPLHQRSVERNTAHKMTGLENKLKRDVSRAEKTAKKVTTIEGRKNVLAEFKRLEAGGLVENSLLKPKPLSKLQERIGRAQNKAKRPLGRMASSIKTEISGDTLRVFSEVEWAGAHNDGAVVGHGAELPQREFLAVEEEDLDALEAFILDEVEALLTEQ